MLSWFIKRRLESFEKSYDYDVSYLQDMLAQSPTAVIKFFRAASLGEFREGISKDAIYAARLVSIVAEDCGPCTQLGVTMAERDGISPELIRNVIAGRFDALPEPVRATALFTIATMKRSPEADELREQVERHFGRLGLISIAFAITASRMYPTVKYALGYGHECRRVTVDGQAVSPGAALKVAGASAAHSRAIEAVA